MLDNGVLISKSNKLNIANIILIRLGFNPATELSSIEDENFTREREITIIQTVLDSYIRLCLEEFMWSFAIKSTNLVPYVDGGYQIPNDCVRLVGLGEELDCCMQGISSDFVIVDQNNPPVTVVKAVNTYIKQQRSDNFMQLVSFNKVDNRLYYHVNKVSPLCCDYNYKKLYYIHNNIDEMDIPSKFLDLVATKVLSKIIGTTTPDPSGVLAANESKQYYFDLKKLIFDNYSEFKHKVPLKARQNRTDVKHYFRKLSPFRGF